MNGIIQHQALQLEKEKRAIFIQSVEENRVSEVTLKKNWYILGSIGSTSEEEKLTKMNNNNSNNNDNF